MKEEFVYHSSNECIYYKNPNGDECYIYVGDSWNIDENITIEQIEKDFDNMVSQCGEECNAKNRKDLFIFCYAVAKGWIK
jgi:hypothetical protein